MMSRKTTAAYFTIGLERNALCISQENQPDRVRKCSIEIPYQPIPGFGFVLRITVVVPSTAEL